MVSMTTKEVSPNKGKVLLREGGLIVPNVENKMNHFQADKHFQKANNCRPPPPPPVTIYPLNSTGHQLSSLFLMSTKSWKGKNGEKEKK